MKISTLGQVVDYQLCCGCGLCAYLHPREIRMADVPDYGRRPEFIGDDFYRTFPEALALCPGCGLSSPGNDAIGSGAIAELADHWGAVLELWEGYAVDPEIRFNGSSGGALTAIALYCLEREGMHGVLHTASNPKKPHLNRTTFSTDRSALLEAAGSRYSPASPCEQLLDIEQAYSPCVFIGKPCDVAAVYKARRQRPELNARIGLTMACFCAGTPSTKGTLAMLQRMGLGQTEELSALRYRGQGWPGKAVARYVRDGQTHQAELTYEQSWGDILQKYRQWRCYICPDHTGEFADLATGDPWYKSMETEERGLSLIVARTELGRRVIRQAIAAGYLVAETVAPDRLPASQPNLLKTRARIWGQLQALRLANAPAPSYEGFHLFAAWRRFLTMSEKIHSVAGTIKRIRTKRIRSRVQLHYGND